MSFILHRDIFLQTSHRVNIIYIRYEKLYENLNKYKIKT